MTKGRTDYGGVLAKLNQEFPGLNVEIDDSRNLS